MFLLSLLGGFKWYEWVVIAAIGASMLFGYVQYKQIQSVKQDLATTRYSLDIMTIERDRLIYTRDLDDWVNQILTHDALGLNHQFTREQKAFREAYDALLHAQPTVPPPIETSPPHSPEIIDAVVVLSPTQSKDRTDEPAVVLPPHPPTPAVVKDRPAEPVVAPQPTLDTDNERARVRLITQRLHTSYTCATNPLPCTT